MSEEMVAITIYTMPLMLILLVYGIRRHHAHNLSQRHLQEAVEARLTEPASLHPSINLGLCIGCGSCVTACPEKNVLGLIDRQAHLVNPTDCIGHGACKAACPNDAISLVFGSATRGVDIPELTCDFETNISGLFIAGELGGMGLIRNAIEQGRQAMEAIGRYVAEHRRDDDLLDCVIVGAGPAGLSATLGAKQLKLKTETIDQNSAGGTVSHYPRGKLVMTQPADMPLVGKVKFAEVSKEKLLAFWLKVVAEHRLKINENETLTDVQKQTDGSFVVTSDKGSYRCRSVLLAMGRRGTPRKLGVPGEMHSKVVYQLTDPEQYTDGDVLIVGGGDSALEAACSIAELGRCKVALSYRGDSFARAKAKNRLRIEALASTGAVSLYLQSNVICIDRHTVTLEYRNDMLVLDNSAVIVCAGGILPTPFLKKIGIEVSTKYGSK